MYKDLLKKMFCELGLEYEKEIEEVTPHLDAKYLALLKTKDFAIELLIAKTHQYDKLVEKVKELEQALKELEHLKKFKETFDNYELLKKQGFIAYENWQECERELTELKRDCTIIRRKADSSSIDDTPARQWAAKILEDSSLKGDAYYKEEDRITAILNGE